MYFQLGITKAKLKGFLGAIQSFEKALELKPDYYEVYLETAAIKKKLPNRKEDAIRDYDLYIKAKPKDASAYYQRANLLEYYSGSESRKLAILDLDKAIHLNPKFVDAYLLRGKIYCIADNDICIEDFKKVIEIKKDTMDAYLWLARYHAYLKKEKDMNIAIDYLNLAIQVKPDFLESYFEKASIYQRYNRKEMALDVYNLILKKDPNSKRAMHSRANVRFDLKDYKNAKSDYLLVPEKDNWIYNQIGIVETYLSEWESAEKYFSIAIDKSKYFQSDFYYNRARIRTRFKNYEGALNDYDTIIKELSSYASAHYFYERAIIKKALKNYQGMLEDLNAAIQSDEKYKREPNEYILFERGNASFYLKDFVEAEKDYSKAIHINSAIASFYYARAMNSIRRNDFISAQMDLLRTLDLNPESKEMQTDLEILKVLDIKKELPESIE